MSRLTNAYTLIIDPDSTLVTYTHSFSKENIIKVTLHPDLVIEKVLEMEGSNALEFEVRKVIVEKGWLAKGTFEYMKPIMLIEAMGTSIELYNKAIKWINEENKYQKHIIKESVEGDYFIFEGSVLRLIRRTGSFNTGENFFDVRYTIKLNFKDGTIKYEITNLENFGWPSSFVPTTEFINKNPNYAFWSQILKNNEVGYKIASKKGKINKDGTYNFNAIKSYFENIGLGLNNYVQKNDFNSEKDVCSIVNMQIQILNDAKEAVRLSRGYSTTYRRKKILQIKRELDRLEEESDKYFEQRDGRTEADVKSNVKIIQYCNSYNVLLDLFKNGGEEDLNFINNFDE